MTASAAKTANDLNSAFSELFLEQFEGAIADLAAAKTNVEPMKTTKTQSHNQIRELLQSAFDSQFPSLNNWQHISDVFEDDRYFVVERDDTWWSVRYSFESDNYTYPIDADEYEFSPQSEWVEVAPTTRWRLKAAMHTSQPLAAFGQAVKAIKSPDGLTGTVEAVGLQFGSPDELDLDDTYFSAKTYFGKHGGNGVDATFNHRIPLPINSDDTAVKSLVGALRSHNFKNPISVEDTVFGKLTKHILDLQDEYEAYVFSLATKGALRWSAGTAGHLLEVEDDGHIKSFPIIEWAYTPVPAEHRLPKITPTKSLTEIKLNSTPNELKASAESVSADSLDTTQGTDDEADLDDADNTPEVKNHMDEKEQDNGVVAVAYTQEQLDAAIKAAGANGAQEAIKAMQAEKPTNNGGFATKSVNYNSKTSLGDTESSALKAFVMGEAGNTFSLKASNATDMNIGTAADGGNAVPTGMYGQIIARRDETLLAARLPIMRIPGVGTTVDVPLDSEADGEFIATAEAATFDLDAPALGKKSLTLANYSKYVDVSYQLLDDSAANIESFLADFVGRGMAKTHNNLLLTEVATNGTAFTTFAGTNAIAFGEPENILGNDDLSPYLDDDNAAAWVMRNSTKWAVRSIVGDDRQYYTNTDGSNDTLLGYPVYTSQKAGAMSANGKSVYFGNWRYVGMREGTEINFIRDPYTVANKGQIRLLWNFRTVYGVLQSEAIGYGAQAAS